jgi:hypothetical protein
MFKTVDQLEQELREGKKPYLTAGCYRGGNTSTITPEELKKEIESQGK